MKEQEEYEKMPTEMGLGILAVVMWDRKLFNQFIEGSQFKTGHNLRLFNGLHELNWNNKKAPIVKLKWI